MVFDQNMQLIGVIDVEVTLDTGTLQERIRASTGSRGIRVGSSNGQIVLSGVAGNAVAADRAVEVAKAMVPKGGNIVNAMTVAPAQQVMLRVRFLEVGRSASRGIGVNGLGANNAGTEASRPAWARPPRGADLLSARRKVCRAAGRRPVSTRAETRSRTRFDPKRTWPSDIQYRGDFAACDLSVQLRRLLVSRWPVSPPRGGSLDITLTALEEKGLIRRFAEPDLVALSGDTAAFLAGGEFPVPSVQPGGTGGVPVITTDYKPFGVQLTFVPTVLAGGIINLRLAPSVTSSTSHRPYRSPASSSRQSPSAKRAQQSNYATARASQSPGCYSQETNAASPTSWIGSVPVLGALFQERRLPAGGD